MMQSKAKNKYWQAGKRWRTITHPPASIEGLDFFNYKFIFGDKIFTEPTPEAEAAFKSVLMWQQLQAR